MIESKDVTWNFSSIFSWKMLCKSFITMSTFTDKNARKLKGIWYDVFPQLTRFMLHALHPLDLMFYIDISPNITFYKLYCCCVIICVVCPFPPLRNAFFYKWYVPKILLRYIVNLSQSSIYLLDIHTIPAKYVGCSLLVTYVYQLTFIASYESCRTHFSMVLFICMMMVSH